MNATNYQQISVGNFNIECEKTISTGSKYSQTIAVVVCCTYRIVSFRDGEIVK